MTRNNTKYYFCFLNVYILEEGEHWSKVLTEKFVTLKWKKQNPGYKICVGQKSPIIFLSLDVL